MIPGLTQSNGAEAGPFNGSLTRIFKNISAKTMRNRHLCVDPLARTVGPTLRIGVGGPAGCKEAAKRRTEAIRTVGPTLRNGDNNMKLSTACLLITFSVMLVAVKPLAGHHSFDAEYDSKKPINVSGTVTKLDWVNPHAFVF